MTRHNNSALELVLQWQSEISHHTDRIYIPVYDPADLNLSGHLKHCLNITSVTGKEKEPLNPEPCNFFEYDPELQVQVPLKAIKPIGPTGFRVIPRVGRFYPRLVIAGYLGINSHDRQPMRVIKTDATSFTVDLNHPLSGLEVNTGARLVEIQDMEVGISHGETQRPIDPFTIAFGSGIGLQRTYRHCPDYYQDDIFIRQDMEDDALFYQQDRLVAHIDQSASDAIAEIYRRYLRPGMKVLDLMSSIQSHIPTDITDLHVTGLGMNARELSANPQLNDSLVHDLNLNPVLPFDDDYFDITICSLSIEYLTEPLSILREIVRVTRPRGKVLISFSNRFFSTKVVAIWHELHPFERLGLVVDLMRKTGKFNELKTESMQGQPRANDDIYFEKIKTGDPVFVVSGSVYDTCI